MPGPSFALCGSFAWSLKHRCLAGLADVLRDPRRGREGKEPTAMPPMLNEDEERFESAPEASWQTRAQQHQAQLKDRETTCGWGCLRLYSDSIFDREQKMALLNQKIRILQDMPGAF